jgi:hypothetical protein
MNLHRFLPAFLVVAPAFLAHCAMGTNPTRPDPDNASPAAAMSIDQPLDASGRTAWGVVGQPMTVQLSMTQTGPGTCTEYSIDGPHEECTGPDTPLAFQLSSLACDDDLCDVTGIQVGTLTDAYGRPLLGDIVTIVPRSTAATLRATGTSGSFTASASLDLSVATSR